MRIFYKLLLGYILVALLTCVVGYVGVRVNRKIQRGFDVVAEDVIATERALSNLRFEGLRLVTSSAELKYVRRMGAAAQAAHEAKLLEEVKGKISASLASCRKKMLSDPDEVSLFREIELKTAVLQQDSDLFLAAADSGSAVAANERFEIAEQDFLEAVDHAYQKEEAELVQSRGQVTRDLSTSLITMPAVSVATFLVAIACGALLSASIARRLKRLQRGVEQVSRGDLDVRLTGRSRDEVGALSEAFNGMVAELQRSKEEIVATGSDLDRIIHSMVDALFVVSAEGIVERVNTAACSVLKYRMEELVGEPFSKVFHDPSRYELLQQTLHRDGLISEVETACLTKAGEQVPVSFSASTMETTTSSSHHRVWIAHNISSRKEAEQEIEHLAYYDQLTGLPNRFLFHDRLKQAMARAQREKENLALLFFDLDRFKDINDTLGHASGDLLLQLVARRVQAFVRQSDTLARLGGDEFVLLCCSTHTEPNVETVAKKIMELFEAPFDLDGNEGYVTASIGIVFYPTDGSDATTLLRNADLAMYAAKETGRNAYRFFSNEMNHQAQERKDLEVMLRKALLLDQFELHYQPQIDLSTGRIYGVEALLRWRHPERGLIPPGIFIPVAEQTGLIRAVGEWVLREACRQTRSWIEAGYPLVSVAVNVSGSQFLHPSFHNLVESVLTETSLDPSLLELEITESVFMADPKETAQSLKKLKDLKVRLAVDDFGTGYSSLSYLMEFPLDRLKIDRSFIRGISERDHSTVIVDAVIAMGHSLGVRVLAEGVETMEELAYLKAQGCDEAQGFYFSTPVPAVEVAKLLAVPWSESERFTAAV